MLKQFFSRSGIRPIKIGRRLIEEIDASVSTGADGTRIAIGSYSILLTEEDRAALSGLEEALVSELRLAIEQYANDKQLVLLGDITISICTDDTLKVGKFDVRADLETGKDANLDKLLPNVFSPLRKEAGVSAIDAAIDESRIRALPMTVATPSIPPVPAPSAAPPAPEKKAVLVLGDGTKVAVKPGVLSIGRSAESSVPLNDTNVSRRHAEIRSRGEGARIEWYLVDVGSTNGTMLNGVKISGEQKLKNGDALMFGGTAARFEVS